MVKNKLNKLVISLMFVFLLLFSACSKSTNIDQDINIDYDQNILDNKTDKEQVEIIIKDELVIDDVEIGELI